MGAPQLALDGLTGARSVSPMTSSGPEMLITLDRSENEFFYPGSDSFLFGWSSKVGREPLPSDQCSRRCVPGLVGDGVCTPECMNEACGWDGGDCWATCEGQEFQTCYASQLGDGHCDAGCMTAACGWDHNDCMCDHVIDARYGFRASGAEAANYADELRRCWLIEPRPSPGGTIDTITLTFQRFNTEAGFDVVKVYDGPHPESSAQLNSVQLDSVWSTYGISTPWDGMAQSTGYSGLLDVEALPPLTANAHPSMLVTFTSDALIGADGFLFGWTSTERGEALPAGDCAIDCKPAMRGDGHCNPACMNAECGWDAKVAHGSTFGNSMGSHDTDGGDCQRECYPGCKQEQLNDGVCDPACATAECGYDILDCSCQNVLTECDGSATDGSDFDTVYNGNNHRCFLIRPSHNGSRVHLRWDRFDTERDFDMVRAYDGASRLDPPLYGSTGWSGSDLPPPTSSTGATMLVTFDADMYDGVNKGFRFTWTCTGTLDLLSDATVMTGGLQHAGALSPNLLHDPAMVGAGTSDGRGWTVNLVRPDAPLETAWQLEANAGRARVSSGYDLVDSMSLLGTCCIIHSRARGGQMIATSRQGVVREQEVDLLALGFSPRYLDSAPPIHVSESFAQLPPGLHDEHLLRVELRGAAHEVLAHWDVGGGALQQSPAQCTSMCELRRRDGSDFWLNRTHTFVSYGRGVRYVHWRDGGRDADAYEGHSGALIDAPSLKVTLDASRGCAASCGAHGHCAQESGMCLCAEGWQGTLCETPMHPLCPFNCSGRGTCSMHRGVPSCECHGDSVGTYCTKRVTELEGNHQCSDGTGSALRKGIDLSLDSHVGVGLVPHPRLALRQNERVLERVPLVKNGIVLPDWTYASARLQSNGTEALSFNLSVQTPVPATFGVPSVHVDNPTVLSYALKHAFQHGTKAVRGDKPLHLELTCLCVAPGVSRMHLSIPLDEFCSIVVSWVKVCTRDSIDAEIEARKMLWLWMGAWTGLSLTSLAVTIRVLLRVQSILRRLRRGPLPTHDGDVMMSSGVGIVPAPEIYVSDTGALLGSTKLASTSPGFFEGDGDGYETAGKRETSNSTKDSFPSNYAGPVEEDCKESKPASMVDHFFRAANAEANELRHRFILVADSVLGGVHSQSGHTILQEDTSAEML